MKPIPQTNSDRVRRELDYDDRRRPCEIGRVVHAALAAIAATDRMVDAGEIEDFCDDVLANQPINAPKQLDHPLAQIYPATGAGVRLLPPLGWTFVGSEAELDSGSIVDLVFHCDEPAVVGDHLGDLFGVEVKLAAATDTAILRDTRAQVAQHLDGLVSAHGDRVLGVATYCLGHRPLSLLTLADTDRTEILLHDTPLVTPPEGRIAW